MRENIHDSRVSGYFFLSFADDDDDDEALLYILSVCLATSVFAVI